MRALKINDGRYFVYFQKLKLAALESRGYKPKFVLKHFEKLNGVHRFNALKLQNKYLSDNLFLANRNDYDDFGMKQSFGNDEFTMDLNLINQFSKDSKDYNWNYNQYYKNLLKKKQWKDKQSKKNSRFIGADLMDIQEAVQNEPLKPKSTSLTDPLSKMFGAIFLVVNFDPRWSNIAHFLNEFEQELRNSNDPDLDLAAYPKGCFKIANATHWNLSRYLSVKKGNHVLYEKSTVDPGSFECTRHKCTHIFGALLVTRTWSHELQPNPYIIRYHLDCTSLAVVYVLRCKICGCCYVGSTMNPVCMRCMGHRRNIIKIRKGEKVDLNYLFVYNHFVNGSCFNIETDALDSGFEFIFIDCAVIRGLTGNKKLDYALVEAELNRKEIFWIGQLNSFRTGLNSTADWRNLEINRRNYSGKHNWSKERWIKYKLQMEFFDTKKDVSVNIDL